MHRLGTLLISLLLGTIIGLFTVAKGAGPAAPALQLRIVQRDSKVTFASKTMRFLMTVGSGVSANTIECRDRGAWMQDMNQDLLKGWKPEAATSNPKAKGEYIQIASCRSAKMEAIGWFGIPREYTFNISEQLQQKDYQPAALPLQMRLRETSGGEHYYSCSTGLSRWKTGEGHGYDEFTVTVACDPIAKLAAAQTGIPDFLTTPGPYAAIAGYRLWPLPWTAGTKQNFDSVAGELLKLVPAGTYSGAMSTLGKTCELKIERIARGLKITHVIEASKTSSKSRTRVVELSPEALIGSAEGDVFKDPIRINEPAGKMVAAEFRKDPVNSLYVMFEKRTDGDGLVVRINGPEAYCRRLVKK